MQAQDCKYISFEVQTMIVNIDLCATFYAWAYFVICRYDSAKQLLSTIMTMKITCRHIYIVA